MSPRRIVVRATNWLGDAVMSIPALRALRTERTSRIEREGSANIMAEFGTALDLYFGGDMEASIALSGQVAGRIDAVKPVRQIIEEIVSEYRTVAAVMAPA